MGLTTVFFKQFFQVFLRPEMGWFTLSVRTDLTMWPDLDFPG